MLHYVDHILMLGQVRDLLVIQTAEVFREFQRLGFLVNWNKPDLELEQYFCYVRVGINSVTLHAGPTASRWAKFSSLLKRSQVREDS